MSSLIVYIIFNQEKKKLGENYSKKCWRSFYSNTGRLSLFYPNFMYVLFWTYMVMQHSLKTCFFFCFFFVISKKNFSLQQTHSYSTLEIINNKIRNFNLGNLIIIWIVKNSHKNCLFLNMPSHFLVQHKYL